MASSVSDSQQALRGSVRVGEWSVTRFLRCLAYLSVLITVGITAILLWESLIFFTEVSPVEFLAGTQWTPLFEPRHFGVLPIVWGTILVAGGACLLAIPAGLLVALFLSEVASEGFREIAKPVLELLAGIPSVVFGYFALTTITPLLRSVYPETEVFNALSAAVVVAIMILPMIASLSDDAMQAVPKSMRDAGIALGATRSEVMTQVVMPAAMSGIAASAILAFSRAIGETMAVTLAAGATPNLTLNLTESIQTMTAYIVQVSLGDTPHGTIEYRSLFAVGLVLFLMTLATNLTAKYVMKRLKRKYG